MNWQRRTEPADLVESMDEPCSYDDLRACLRDLGQVNRITRGFTPTLRFLDQVIARKKAPAHLRILDVGSGGGDTLHRVARWARRRAIPVQLTGIDLNPMAARVANEQYGNSGIQWLTGDVFDLSGDFDLVLSSLLTHHLATGDVVRFVGWMEDTAALAWFVNDLERSARSASLFGLLAQTLRWHRFVRHDGPVSFARSFSCGDWAEILTDAGIPPETVRIAPSFPARLCVSRFK